MDPINEAYQKDLNTPIDEKKLDWQKVFNKSFKMKIGDTLSNKGEYANYDYQIIDMWLETKRVGDEQKFEVMVKVKREMDGDKDTVVLPLKDLDDGKESFESNVNFPNG
jgi:hypothetical protein